MKLIITLISFLMSLLIFLGCGSDISTSSPIQTPNDSNNSNGLLHIALNGVVVDGYIKGAKVCLDTNPMDGECNIDETVVYTDSDGKFDFGTGYIKSGGGLSYIAYGGVDTATGKAFESKLRFVKQVYDNSLSYITPLTDLVATDFFNKDSKSISDLDSSQDKVAVAFGIQKQLLYANPYKYGGVFIKSQEIQQIKSILGTAANKVADTELTFPEKLSLEDKIKISMLNSITQNNGYFKTQSTFENLQSYMQDLSFLDGNFAFMDNVQNFITDQLTKIRLDLDNFNNTFKSYDPRFDDYQVALEDKAEIAYEMINNSVSTDTLVPFDLNIDVYSQGSDNNDNNDTTGGDDNNDTTTGGDDNNETIDESKTSVSFSGVVADGHIKDALVCIDEDLNGICSAYDHRTYSDENGVYSFEEVELDKDSDVRIVAIGGVDTFTNKSRVGSLSRTISTSDLLENTQIVISPMTDLVTINFLKNSTTILDSELDLSVKFNTTSEQLLSDPTTDKDLFLDSLYLEQVKRSVEKLFTQEVNDLTLLRTNIKKALLSGLNQGYDSLLAEKVLNSMMTTYEKTVNSDVYYKLFEEFDTLINNLKTSEDIKVYTLANVQKILEDKTSEVVYTNMNSADLNISIDSIVASDFDKTDAEYDLDACKPSIYANTLTDSNETSEIEIDKSGNGISLSSKYDSVTLYYPNLGVEKSASILSYTDNPGYQLQFDEAWVGEGKSAYIKTLSRDNNLSECYKIDFDSYNLTVEKVFSYSYN